MSANPALSDETMAGSATLSKLKTLASKMRDPTLYSTLNPSVSLSHAPLLSHADIAAISQFGQLLNERDGISFFELAQSGLVEALLSTSPQRMEASMTGSTDSNPTSPSGAGKGLKEMARQARSVASTAYVHSATSSSARPHRSRRRLLPARRLLARKRRDRPRAGCHRLYHPRRRSLRMPAVAARSSLASLSRSFTRRST